MTILAFARELMSDIDMFGCGYRCHGARWRKSLLCETFMASNSMTVDVHIERIRNDFEEFEPILVHGSTECSRLKGSYLFRLFSSR